jgi:hypothetical protein
LIREKSYKEKLSRRRYFLLYLDLNAFPLDWIPLRVDKHESMEYLFKLIESFLPDTHFNVIYFIKMMWSWAA